MVDQPSGPYGDPLLDEAIAAGRWPPKPSPELLSMVAKMIRPILREQAEEQAREARELRRKVV